MTEMTPEIADRFARAALGHVAREFPHKLDHVIAGPEDVRGPRDLHPIFFGSFDWHSCVHGWWTLFSLVRLYPQAPFAADIRALADATFTPANGEAEAAYARRPTSRGFERPYGWGWLLKLAAELERHGDEAAAWRASLAPLVDAIHERFAAYLPLATYPVRVGTHYNTAFAFTLALDWAATARPEFADELKSKLRDWHADDRDCPAWEPSQDEFLSPALMEALAMSRVLPRAEFAAWFDAFLPRAGEGVPATVFRPASVSDRSDGKIAHLDGLNLSRAWCWRGIAAALPADHPAESAAKETASRHLEAALPHVTGDYMGEHWLASFALLALQAPGQA